MHFSLAQPSDEAALRKLFAETPLPGPVSLRYTREPNYFWGCGIYGHETRTVVVKTQKEELAAACCWSSRRRFVNGRDDKVDYIAGLRVAPQFRGRWIIPPGFKALREFVYDGGDARGSLIAITDGNERVTKLLAHYPRRFAPTLRPVDFLHTVGLVVRKRFLPTSDSALRVAPLEAEALSEVVGFWRAEGRKRQFFPIFDEKDFERGSVTTRGLRPSDILVCRQGGQIVGTLGLWDQSSCKQVVVESYGKALRALRPIYDIAARVVGMRPFPRPGEMLSSAYGAFLCIRDDDPRVFRSLLAAAYRQAAARDLSLILIGFSERDPLLPLLKLYPKLVYRSTLYTADWRDGGEFHDYCDGRVPYVDVATL